MLEEEYKKMLENVLLEIPRREDKEVVEKILSIMFKKKDKEKYSEIGELTDEQHSLEVYEYPEKRPEIVINKTWITTEVEYLEKERMLIECKETFLRDNYKLVLLPYQINGGIGKPKRSKISLQLFRKKKV